MEAVAISLELKITNHCKVTVFVLLHVHALISIQPFSAESDINL